MRTKHILMIFIVLMSVLSCVSPEESQPAEPGNIIVLMYHRIVNGKATNLYERSSEDFENDLKFLKANSINVITFNDLERIFTSGQMPEGNSAILTFDDGDHSWYSIVKPLLLEYKMKATFFLWVYMIGHESFIDWNEVEQMSHYVADDGEKPFLFASHSYSHSYLLDSKPGFPSEEEYNSFLDYEFGVSKNLIESHTNTEVNIFALPYGDGAGDPEIIAAAKRNGYKFIRTSKWGAITDPQINLFEIPSLPILDNTTTDLIGSYLNL
jgi:peptidoglycan/xylan/chitin deacetylase (PgdA/CDA1 family)